MNFSEKRKLSRLLSLILVLALSVTLLAGCGKKKEEAPENDTFNSGLNLDLTGTGKPAETTEAPVETTAPEVNENTATVTGQINIRSSPSTEATIVGTLYAGDRVEISRREEVTGINWAYIIAPEAGWIVMEFVEMDIPQDAPVEDTSTPGATASTEATEATTGNAGNATDNTQGKRGVITASTLYIRENPSTDSKSIGGYVKGDVVSILETKNGWGRTNKGWVKMDYVSTTGGTTTNNNTNTNTGNGSTTVQFRGIVTAGELNIRDSANGNRVGKYVYGDRVEILEKSNGWGRTTKGWISLDYVWQDGSDSTNAVNGTVTGNGLRIRTGPGTGYDSIGSYNTGDSIRVLNRFTYNGVTWGCTNKGWVSMQYVDIGDAGNNNNNNTTTDGNNYKVTVNNALRIRDAAGTGNIVGSLDNGDIVTITEKTTIDGVTWGKIAQGWISMDYVVPA